MEFLEQSNRKTYCRITSLSINDIPQESFEGRISAGSINIDGASAIRRTCQLTVLTDTVNLSDYFWSLNTRFKLEIGLENGLTNKLTWFNQGIFIITSFNQSLSSNAHSFSISGKDKMCLLNGEVGGSLPFEVDFGKYEEVDENGVVTIKEYPIKEIIREAVHHYGQEPFHNIIINDLDESGLILQEYRYDNPLYLIRKADTNIYTNISYNGDTPITINNIATTLSNIPQYDVLVDLNENNSPAPTEFSFPEGDSKPYCAAKIEYGQTVGYTETELVYQGDLIGKPGESITSILDKITKMLGNYEYFYNVEGQFIFQKKHTYVNESWNPIVKSDGVSYIDSSAEKFSYKFTDSKLFSVFNNTPNISNLKNDYSIWGSRKSSSGAQIPIHYRYAIDTKPVMYTTIQVQDEELINYNNYYGTYLTGQNSRIYLVKEVLEDDMNYIDLYKNVLILNTIKAASYEQNIITFEKPKPESKQVISYNNNILTIEGCPISEVYIVNDWREIIYQMAKDYRKYNHLHNFNYKIKEANSDLYPTGYTGYEQYYVDLEGFWRQLYSPDLIFNSVTPIKERLSEYYELEQIYKSINEENIINGQEIYYYDAEKEKYERVRWPYEEEEYYYLEERYKLTTDQKIEQGKKYYQISNNYYPFYHEHAFWNKDVYENPDKLNFWFDFLDTNSELNKFNVRLIGARPKVVNDNKVKSIYNRKTPTLIFTDEIAENQKKEGYYYIRISPEQQKLLFSISSQSKSAKDALDDLLYQNTYCVESVSITSIPIYTLQPNSLVYIEDQERGIKGEYIVSKFTIPLTYNGTMSITATKAVNRLF